MYKIESKLNFDSISIVSNNLKKKPSDSNISNVCFNYFEQLVT